MKVPSVPFGGGIASRQTVRNLSHGALGVHLEVEQEADFFKHPAVQQMRFVDSEQPAAGVATLTASLFPLILEWEEIMMNYRATLEREWLYYAGINDGLNVGKHLLNHVPD